MCNVLEAGVRPGVNGARCRKFLEHVTTVMATATETVTVKFMVVTPSSRI